MYKGYLIFRMHIYNESQYVSKYVIGIEVSIQGGQSKSNGAVYYFQSISQKGAAGCQGCLVQVCSSVTNELLLTLLGWLTAWLVA